MRILLLALALFLLAAAPAHAWKTKRCAPQADTTLGRTAAGTVAYSDFGDIFACRRGGRAIRIGSFPNHGLTHVRLAGGFAALVTEDCNRDDGRCGRTEITVWNLRRYDRSARHVFGSDGNEPYGHFLDMELCASGALALLVQVGANREVWSMRRDRWWRNVASPDIDPQLERDGATVWTTESGQRSVGYGVC